MTKDTHMIAAMRKYGGSFVKSLAECMEHADPNNYTKLVTTFQNYVYDYRQMAIKEQSQSMQPVYETGKSGVASRGSTSGKMI